MDIKSGEIVWRLANNTETNEKYNEIKSNLQRVIKQAHDLLYSNCSIVGVKAQNDIMRVLVLVIMKPYFNDENSEIYQMCLANKDKVVGFNKYMPYCKDLSLIAKEENPLNKWATFVKKFLIHIFPAVYYEDDAKFNFTDDITFMNLINIINTLEVNDDFIDAFASTCGDIHESFRAYGGGQGAKELGQFFTPRHLIHLIFHGLGLQDIMKEMNDISIYDCCMGTGAFLARMYSLGDIKPENIYGCETEKDTIKFGEASMLLTTKSICNNIVKCDSLCENPFIHTKKMKMIVTNPPFGTKMKYKDLQKKFDEKFKDNPIKFKEIYPVEVNNGACLFIQHCVYMLDEGGVCAIVLPDGELFDGNGKWPKAFRKWWCETVNIIKILKVPSGTFEHTGIKTNVVIFVKNGPTQNIQFMQTTKDCDSITNTTVVSFHELASSEFSLDVGRYMPKSTKVLNNMVKFGDLCKIKNGQSLNKSELLEGTYLVYGGGMKPMGTHNSHNVSKNTIVISNVGAYAGFISLTENNAFVTSNASYIVDIRPCVTYKYLYIYMKYIAQDDIYKCQKGAGQPKIDKDMMSDIEIPVPSLEVQQEIVQALSDLEQSINTIKTRIDQLKREKDMYMKHGRTAEIRELLKDCEMKTLGEVCSINPETLKSNSMKVISYIDVSSVKEGQLLKMQKLTEDFPSRAKRIIRQNDILYSTVRPNLKGYVFLNEDIENGIASTGYAVIRVTSQSLLPLFVYYYITQDTVNKQIVECATGAIYPSVSHNVFEKLSVPLPEVELQQQCIEIYKQKEAYLNELQVKIEKEKEYIEELKKLGKDVIASYCP